MPRTRSASRKERRSRSGERSVKIREAPNQPAESAVGEKDDERGSVRRRRVRELFQRGKNLFERFRRLRFPAAGTQRPREFPRVHFFRAARSVMHGSDQRGGFSARDSVPAAPKASTAAPSDDGRNPPRRRARACRGEFRGGASRPEIFPAGRTETACAPARRAKRRPRRRRRRRRRCAR